MAPFVPEAFLHDKKCPGRHGARVRRRNLLAFNDRNILRRRLRESIRFLNTIEAQVSGKVIHTIADGYATQEHPKVSIWLSGTIPVLLLPEFGIIAQRGGRSLSLATSQTRHLPLVC
jgi:hypothetical protein